MQIYQSEVIHRFRERFCRLYGDDQADACVSRLKMMVGRYGVGIDPVIHPEKWDQATTVLITYADMIATDDGSPLQAMKRFCDERLDGAINHVHLLPFFPYSSDDGFSVIDYREVNPDCGHWHDVEALGEHFHLMFDLVLNHCSRRSEWFKQFTMGYSPGQDYFHTADPETDVSQVVRPRTHPLLTPVQTRIGERYAWTTFSADQIDLDFSNPDVLFEFLDILFWYVSKGARIVRMDAIAYLWKVLGTSCIHLPETHEVVKLFRDVLDLVNPSTLILTETNVPHAENVSYFGDGDEADMIYQFSLPPLTLHALLNGSARRLTDWAASLGALPPGCTYLNFTASHDGIGVRPLEGLVPDEEVQALADHVRSRGGHVNYKRNADGSESPYELNITYFDALVESDGEPSELDLERFLCSQTIALSLKGVPAAYFHSLSATRNWNEGVEKLGHNRAINRMKWQEQDLKQALEEPNSPTARVFGEYVRRLRIRVASPAFHPDGAQTVLDLDDRVFALERTAPGGAETILSLSNVSRETVCVDLAGQMRVIAEGEVETLPDLMAGEEVGPAEVTLAPYQTRWLVLSRE